MPNPSTISYGNIKAQWVLAITISPSSVAPNTTVEQTFTVNGLLLGDMVDISKPTTQTGLGIVNTRVSAANTLAIAFINATAATITPTANEVYYIEVSRPENLTSNNSALAQIVS
jgi:hypothetical protein